MTASPPYTTPRYTGASASQRHFIYGVNCYQFAIGFKPVSLAFDAATRNIAYLSLCPGNMAQEFHKASAQGHHLEFSSHAIENLVINGCLAEGLRPISAPLAYTNIPQGERLLALLFSHERCDFDFYTFDKETGEWQNKTHFAEINSRPSLPLYKDGGYKLREIFTAKENMTPLGLPQGLPLTLLGGQSIHLLDSPPDWAHGPVLRPHQHMWGYWLNRHSPVYAEPDLSFV